MDLLNEVEREAMETMPEIDWETIDGDPAVSVDATINFSNAMLKAKKQLPDVRDRFLETAYVASTEETEHNRKLLIDHLQTIELGRRYFAVADLLYPRG